MQDLYYQPQFSGFHTPTWVFWIQYSTTIQVMYGGDEYKFFRHLQTLQHFGGVGLQSMCHILNPCCSWYGIKPQGQAQKAHLSHTPNPQTLKSSTHNEPPKLRNLTTINPYLPRTFVLVRLREFLQPSLAKLHAMFLPQSATCWIETFMDYLTSGFGFPLALWLLISQG